MTGIVVLNYRTWGLSKKCMESIRGTCAAGSYRIYLVDNASENPMPDSLRLYLSGKPEIQLLRAGANRGYAAGNNIGIGKALSDGCDTILVANNDIVFRERAVEELAGCLKRHPGAGIAGPKVVDGMGRVQASHCSMRTGMKEIFQLHTAAKWVFRKKWGRYYCLDQDPDVPRQAYHVSGCCFAISRACAQKVMPRDEGTMLYHEEPILGIRMEQAGYSTWYEPGSVVVHRHGATTEGARPFMHQCITQSELYYCSRYLRAKKWQLHALYWYRRILFLLRCITSREMRGYWGVFRKKQEQYLRMACKESMSGQEAE